MTHPVQMIVPLTPDNVLPREDLLFLDSINVGRQWLFEYVLAMYGVLEDLRTVPSRGEDHMYEQFASDLDDSLTLDDPKKFDHLFHLMTKIMDTLRPYVDPISAGLPDHPVEVITFEPFIVPPKGRVLSPVARPKYIASLLTFHLEDPNPNWLHRHEMWKEANDETPEHNRPR